MAIAGPVQVVRTVTVPCSRQGPYRDTPHRSGDSKHHPVPMADRSTPRHHGQFLRGSDHGTGQRAVILTVFARPGVGVAVGVISELGEHPGTKDGSQTGLGQNDLSVRVLTKMRINLLLQGLDLAPGAWSTPPPQPESSPRRPR
jgi:hypothetical protein